MIIATILYRQKLLWMQKIEKFRAKHEDLPEIVADIWELSWDRLLIKSEKIGSGAYGQVFRGKIHGRPPCIEHVYPADVRIQAKYEDCEVAIKMLPKYATEAAKKEFMNEIELMKQVSGRNENIVDMLGCITVGQAVCLVLEYCPNRDLLHYVKAINVDVQEVRNKQVKNNRTKKSR